jgi:SAM-dependent methyltransferase
LAALELWLRATQQGAGWRCELDALQADPPGAAFLSGRTWGAEIDDVVGRHATALEAAGLDGLEAAIAEREASVARLRDEARGGTPAPVSFGDLRRLAPVSPTWGFDRGQPIDRYYIERFLKQHQAAVRGRCLEIKEAAYTKWLGDGRTTALDVLDIDERNARATRHGDLTVGAGIPDESYDCFVLTQTLHLLYDHKGALAHAVRVLKPGGTLLLTVPAVSRVPPEEGSLDTDYWRFTEASVRRLLSELLPLEAFEVSVYGNVLAATAFLQGLAAEELRAEELDQCDPHFPVIVAARATKP